MKNNTKICLCIIIGLGAFGVCGSAVLFFVNIPSSLISAISAWVGIIGTAASVVLSVAAMVYSNKSSKDAEDSLNKVTSHYETLCKKLASDAIVDSVGSTGVLAIIKDNQEQTEQDT